MPQRRPGNSPIKDGITEGTGGAGTTEEQVPESVSERGGLRVGAEGVRDVGTTEGDGDDLALGLAVLDVLRQELAVEEGSAGEVGTTAALNVEKRLAVTLCMGGKSRVR